MRSCSSETRRRLAIAAVSLSFLLGMTTEAGAIPAFARRYGQSCNLCHAPFPRLTTTGQQVAGHGFRMAPGEVSPDAMNGGDPLLALPKSVPIALRVDGYFRVYGDRSETVTDFESPWVMKILSSAPLGGNLSYYFYFLMDEFGEVAGAEDAFLYYNDAWGRPLDFALGQFQVSDPLFKRELRLPVDDYMIYRLHVGEQPATLAYDRGRMMVASPSLARMTFEVLNGGGLGAAADGRYDDDPNKNLFLHATRDLGTRLRLGALGYWGRQHRAGAATNELWMAGGDATVALAPFELNLQYVHREDDHPTFTPDEDADVTDGGFAELLWLPEQSRWYGYALYNRAEDRHGLLDIGDGAPSATRLYEAVSVGAGFLAQRNARLHAEVLYDT